MYGIAFRYNKEIPMYDQAVDVTKQASRLCREAGKEAVGTTAMLGTDGNETVWVAVVGTADEMQLPLFDFNTVPTIN